MTHALAIAQLAAQSAGAPSATLLGTLGPYLLGTAVLIAAVLGAVWIGRRLRSDLARDRTAEDAAATAALGPSELTARHVFRTLQEKKIATAAELAAMSPRERQLLFDAVATRVTPLAGMPAVRSAAGGRRESASSAAPTPPAPAGVGSLHCPACGSALAVDPDAPRSVTHCDSCGRRVAARRDGLRLSVTVDER